MKWEEILTGSQKEIKKFLSENSVENIYGVKLTGESEWSIKNIEPYRPGHQTPLQAVAEICGIALSEHQNSVVVNTTSWIPGLQNLGLAQGALLRSV